MIYSVVTFFFLSFTIFFKIRSRLEGHRKNFFYFKYFLNFLFYVGVLLIIYQGFPGGSAGKESACNAGDPSRIPGSRRCAGEGIGYPLQFSWAFLLAQLVKSPPAMRETWVRSLGQGRSPGEGNGSPLQYSRLETPMDRGAWWVARGPTSMGLWSQTGLSN